MGREVCYDFSHSRVRPELRCIRETERILGFLRYENCELTKHNFNSRKQ
jgi:hypothetical protein